jgi:hypothetical protein
MRFIGDVHACFKEYVTIAEASPTGSIQVGDFGVGFGQVPNMNPKHRFIRGNHDNPEDCKLLPNWIADGTLEDDIFYCGGARSIDQSFRCEGVDWWRDEELSIGEYYEMYDQFVLKGHKPKIIVTHDLPSKLTYHMSLVLLQSRVELDNFWMHYSIITSQNFGSLDIGICAEISIFLVLVLSAST